MLGMVILVGMGERMADRFLPIYLLALGGGALSVGILTGLQNFLGAVYSLIGGHLSDRIGIKRSLLLFNLLALAGYVVVILVPRWEAVIIGSLLFLSWSAISLPATMSLVAEVLPKNKRTMGVTMHSLVRRFPMALGPLLGGACITWLGTETGIRVGFGFAAAMVLLAIVIQQNMIREDKGDDTQDHQSRRSPLALFRLMSPELRRLLIADILVRFCEQIPNAFVVIWCMEAIRTPVSAFQFGILTTVEMATAVAIYIPVAYLADKSHKKPFVVMTFVFFTLFPLVLMFCHSFWPLVAAFVLRGLKEFGEPTRKALIMDLAPENQKAGMFGLYYLLRDTIVSVAALSGAWLWTISPNTNLLTAFGFGVLGTLWFAYAGRDVVPKPSK